MGLETLLEVGVRAGPDGLVEVGVLYLQQSLHALPTHTDTTMYHVVSTSLLPSSTFSVATLSNIGYIYVFVISSMVSGYINYI